MDSLDIVEFVMDIEKEFGTSIPDTVGSAFEPHASLADVWRAVVVAQTGREPSGPPPAYDPTWVRLRRLAATHLDLPLDDVNATTRLGI